MNVIRLMPSSHGVHPVAVFFPGSLSQYQSVIVRFRIGKRKLTSGPKTTLPKQTSLTNYIFDSVASYPKQTAMIDYDTGKSLTFEELQSEIEHVVCNLGHRGIGRNDVITYFGSNHMEIIHLLCACARIGAILSLANAQLTTDELVVQLKTSSTKLLMTSPECAITALSATQTLGLKNPYVIGQSFDELKVRRTRNDQRFDVAKGDNPLLLPFSSGTTGLPKGVKLSHANLISQLHAIRHPLFLPMTPTRDVSVCVIPMVHISGLVIGALSALSQGATTVLLRRFSLESFLAAIQQYKGTFSLIAPPIMTMLAKDPKALGYDLTSLSTLFSGAAPLDRKLTEAVSDRLNMDCIRQGYGMTETSPATHVCPLSGWKFGSVGVPLPNTECKIVSVSDKNELGANEEGELWVRGPQVMLGYHDNEEANRQIFTDDGWLKTGDIGYYDEEGHYFICDRIKDVIKYKGYQPFLRLAYEGGEEEEEEIAPAYLESVLLTHPNVQEVAVFATFDSNGVEVPRAWVRLNDSHSSLSDSENILQDYVNERVAPYKRLRGGIRLVDEIPKSASGKLLRRRIRDLDERERTS